MSNKERAAMQQALEMMDAGSYIPAMRVLREALSEQAEQEPVAWYLDIFDENGELEDREYNSRNVFSCGRGNGTPLYAAPVRTKDLTDDEIEALAEQFVGQQSIALCRSVIAADRAKNNLCERTK